MEFDLLSLAENDTRLMQHGGYAAGPCPFCGGTDRFIIKKDGAGYRWYCRKCGDGKYHTALDYIMKRQRLDVWNAMLWAVRQPSEGLAGLKKPLEKIIAHGPELPLAVFQREALREMWTGFDILQDTASAQGDPGRSYLQQRGIRLEAANCWRIGFTPAAWDPSVQCRRPALILPWWEYPSRASDPLVTAIRYRFIDDHPGGLRYMSRPGGKFVIYGLWSYFHEDRTLMLVEGELNAVSIWQMAPAGVTVMSFGSEGGIRSEALKQLAARYERVIVWADAAEKARQLCRLLPGAAAIHSPQLKGKEWDANQMLKERCLAGFLFAALKLNCTGRYLDPSDPPGSIPEDKLAELMAVFERANRRNPRPQPKKPHGPQPAAQS